MNDSERLEIQWRQLMLKKLNLLFTRMNKEANKEIEEIETRQKDIRELYPTERDAQDAYGYELITEDEYRSIVDTLATKIITPAIAARDELKSLISRYKKDIRDFEWEALPETEKERIRASNKTYRDSLR